jgi:hypothetical protein
MGGLPIVEPKLAFSVTGITFPDGFPDFKRSTTCDDSETQKAAPNLK